MSTSIKFLKHRAKSGQSAFIETIFVLGFYLLMVGLLITGFQLFYNKMAFGVAAYEAVRTAIAYNTDVSLAEEENLDNYRTDYELTNVNLDYKSASGINIYSITSGAKKAAEIVEANKIGKINGKIEVKFYPDDSGYGENFTYEVGGRCEFLFPLIPATIGFGDNHQGWGNSMMVRSGFTMARERKYD